MPTRVDKDVELRNSFHRPRLLLRYETSTYQRYLPVTTVYERIGVKLFCFFPVSPSTTCMLSSISLWENRACRCHTKSCAPLRVTPTIDSSSHHALLLLLAPHPLDSFQLYNGVSSNDDLLSQVLTAIGCFCLFQHNIQKGVVSTEGSNHFAVSIERNFEFFVL